MHGLLLLLVQVAVILVAARAVGLVFRWFNQPQVVGEMVAGILLGPSLLGWVAPGVSAAVFPPESLGLASIARSTVWQSVASSVLSHHESAGQVR